MNYFKYKKILRPYKKITLSESEKSELKQDLLSKTGLDDTHFYVSAFNAKTLVTAVTAFLLVVGAPLSYAAESSVPGDILYPIKTTVNEKVKRTVNTVARRDASAFEINLLEEKLKEAEDIISNERLDDKRKEKAKRAISNQVERAIKASNIEFEIDISDDMIEDVSELLDTKLNNRDGDKNNGNDTSKDNNSNRDNAPGQNKDIESITNVDIELNNDSASNSDDDTDRDEDRNDRDDNDRGNNGNNRNADSDDDNDNDRDNKDDDKKDEKDDKSNNGRNKVDEVLDRNGSTLDRVDLPRNARSYINSAL